MTMNLMYKAILIELKTDRANLTQPYNMALYLPEKQNKLFKNKF